MKDFSELKNKFLSSIGKAADSGKEFAGKAADSGKDFFEKAADKAKAGTRIAKLSVEIATEKENMKKAYLEIGKLYYDTHKDDPEGFFIQLCEEVALAQKNIADKEAEIEDLKGGKDDDDDVTVEFEEVVSEAENEAAEAVEDAKETFGDKVEDVVEEIKEAAEEAKEKIEDVIDEIKGE